jgi:hypothetical protein
MTTNYETISTGERLIALIRKEAVGINGRAFELYDAPLIPATTQTADGTGDVFEMGDLDALDLKLEVFAASGTTPTLDVYLETSPDGVNDWARCGTFDTKIAASYERQVFGNVSRFVRPKWSITGAAASFNFSVTGEAK